MQEHSERARWVTHLVTVWLENDGDYAENAREIVKQATDAGKDPAAELGKSVSALLRIAPHGSAPWQCAQDLAPNDYNRIRWTDVVESLTED